MTFYQRNMDHKHQAGRAALRWLLAGAMSVGLVGLTVGCEDEVGDDEVGYEPADETFNDNDPNALDAGDDEVAMRRPPQPPGTQPQPQPQPQPREREDAQRDRDMAAGFGPGNDDDVIDAGFYAVQTGLESQGDMMMSTLEFPLADGSSLLVETRSPAEVRVGESFEYEVTVTNASNLPLHDVVVSQYTPMMDQGQQEQQQSNGQSNSSDRDRDQQNNRNQESQSGNQNSSANQGGEQPTKWTIGMLNPNETVSKTIEGTVHSEGTLAMCMTVDYDPSVCTMINVVAPELELRRMIVNADGRPIDEAYICDDFFIVYEVRNVGSGTTEPITISEELPQGFTARGNSNVNLSVEPLGPNESAADDVQIDVEDGTEFSGYAIAETQESGLKVRSDESGIQILDPSIELKVDAPRQTFDNRTLTYELSVTNTSDDPAVETIVRMPLPDQARRVSISSQDLGPEAEQGIFRIGRLDAGETRSFDVQFEASEIGDIALTATADAYCAEAAEKQLMTEVVGVPAIRLETVDLVDPVPQGDTTTYVVRVKNQGTAEDLNIQMQAQLPEQLEYVSGQGDTNVSFDQGTINFAPIDQLDPGEVAEWQITARAVDTGKVRFKLQLTSDANPRQVVEQEPTNLY
ncbi:MAG: hypothetical protein ACOC0P_04090 [Planctomycetota bacterium]